MNLVHRTRRELLKAGLSLLGLGAGMLARVRLAHTAAPAPPDAGTRLALLVDVAAFSDPELARRVVHACHTAHNVPDMSAKMPRHAIAWVRFEPFARAFPEQAADIVPDSVRAGAFPLLCNHCDNPPCVRVCPTGATFTTADGRVGMDAHRCIGCRYCMAACPYGARSFNFVDPRPFVRQLVPSYPCRTRGVVEKCTLCPERLAQGLAPWCVEAAQGAILCGDVNDPGSPIRRLLARYPALRRKTALGTGPAVYYLIR